LANLGGFTVTDNPQASTLDIADAQSAPIVELLSEFGGPVATDSIKTPSAIQWSAPLWLVALMQSEISPTRRIFMRRRLYDVEMTSSSGPIVRREFRNQA
jgi:hypothetical protein